MVKMDQGYYRLLKRNYKTARNRDLYTSLGIQGGSALLGFLGNMYAKSKRADAIKGSLGLDKQVDASSGGSQLQGPTPSGVPMNVGIDAAAQDARNPLGITPEMADLAAESESGTMNLLQSTMMYRRERQSFNERMTLEDLRQKAMDDRASRNEQAMMARLEQQNQFQIQRENWRAFLDVGKAYAKDKLGLGSEGGQQRIRPQDIPDDVVEYHVQEALAHGEKGMTANVMRDRLANGTAGTRTMYPEADLRARARDDSGFLGMLKTVFQGRQKAALPGDTIDPQGVANEANALMKAGHAVRQPPTPAPGQYHPGVMENSGNLGAEQAAQPNAMPSVQVMQSYENEADPARKAQMRQFIVSKFGFDPEG